MMKRIVALMLATVMVFSLAACASKADKAEAAVEAAAEAAEVAEVAEAAAEEAVAEAVEEAVKTYEFTYLSPSTESEYWQYNEVGVRNAIKDLEAEYGVKINLTVVGPATEAETDAYIKAFEGVIAAHPDAIITATLAPDATAPKSKEATEAGIYVGYTGCGIGSETDTSWDDYFGVHYYTDSKSLGEIAAKCMLEGFEARGIEPKGVVGMHMSVVVESLEARLTGFRDYMAANAPDIQVIDTLYNENDVNNGVANCETQISTYGDKLIGLYGANNISGDGIALAIASSGRDDILGIGVDSDSVEIEALENGSLYAIIVQPPYEEAYKTTVDAFTTITTGKGVETKKRVECFCKPITADNMNTEEAQGLLNPKLLLK